MAVFGPWTFNVYFAYSLSANGLFIKASAMSPQGIAYARTVIGLRLIVDN